MALSPDQKERYARHILLKEVGGQGQQKLLSARVALVGAGGIGAPALLYLAAAGVGAVTIIDDDDVALSNLQRQVLFQTSDVGRSKAERAGAAVGRLTPDCQVRAHRGRLTSENAAALLRGHDLVLDGSDNFETRFAVNHACFELAIPLISAAVGRFDGQLATFRPFAKQSPRLPCYQCLVPEAPPPGAVPRCEEEGVLGAVTGVLGSLAALEALKELLSLGDSLAGRLLIYDGLASAARTIKLPHDPACPTCGDAGARG